MLVFLSHQPFTFVLEVIFLLWPSLPKLFFCHHQLLTLIFVITGYRYIAHHLLSSKYNLMMSRDTESTTYAPCKSGEMSLQQSCRKLLCTILNGRGRLSHFLGTRPQRGDPCFNPLDEEDIMIIA